LFTELLEIQMIAQLTSDEAKFVEYANNLANWLECYHDYTRPPPSVVLAEAAKQTELKTGHPLKGIEIPPTNGNHKKEEEPPAIQEPPEIVAKFFSSEHSV
jgi:N-terminal acetyltransferase B complex non-catalytic subunit